MTYVADVLGDGGLMARARKDYAARPGQIEMAEAVDAAMRDGARLLVEGPTGTGKSLAYLVPALWRAVHEGKKCVVVTGSIPLQEQLSRKDLPMLAAVLPWKFEHAMLKGISNYLCLLAQEEAGTDATMLRPLDALASWASSTTTGDFSELEEELEPEVRGKLTTTSEDCLGQRCPRAAECHVLRGRAIAARAHVVVTNYHLFFADLVLRREIGKGILPDYSNVVFDEGHQAAEIARAFFGFKLTPFAIRRWSKRLMPIDSRLHDRLVGASDRFFAALAEYRASDSYKARLLEHDPVDWEPLWHDLRAAEKKLSDAAKNEPDPARSKKIMSAAGSAASAATIVSTSMRQTEDGIVYHVDVEGQGRVALCGQPLDVSRKLREWIFAHPAVSSMVVASATLTAAGSFEMVERELGADGARKLEVESPFDWASQSMVVVPPGLPNPTERTFQAAACAAFVDAVRAARGRTLGLFTSRRMMEAAAAALREARLGFAVMCQGEAPRMKLVERFRADVSSVLIGTSSLWEGVDVPGEALSCVVIDRLPFDSPDDPISDAMNERRRDAFKKWMLPRAILGFRQGTGRLIRSVTDRGVIVVLDRRLVEKPYGKSFLRGLPLGVPLVRGEAAWEKTIADFLR